MRKYLFLIFILCASIAFADSEITGFTETTSPFASDVTVIVTTPLTSATNKKVQIKNLLNGANVTLDGTNMGIGNIAPTKTLDVTGTVRATAFLGDGSNLTGINTGAFTHTGSVTYLTNPADNVGFGTAIPNRKLEIVAADSNTNTSTPSVSSIGIINTDTTNGNLAELGMSTYDTNGSQVIGGKLSTVFTSHTPNGVSGDLVFLNKNSGATQENMRITSNGNVGIGTFNAVTPLTVYTAGVNVATLVSTAPYSSGGGSANLSTYADNGSPLTAGTKFSTLHFGGARDSVHTLVSGGTGLTSYAVEDWSATHMGSRMDFENTPIGSTARGVRMTINGSNLGVNTINPNSRITVAIGGISIGNNAGSSFLTNTAGIGNLILENNIGIGTINPGAALDIGGSGKIRAVGIGTTVPQQVCRKSDGTFGYFDGTWSSTCN